MRRKNSNRVSGVQRWWKATTAEHRAAAYRKVATKTKAFWASLSPERKAEIVAKRNAAIRAAKACRNNANPYRGKTLEERLGVERAATMRASLSKHMRSNPPCKTEAAMAKMRATRASQSAAVHHVCARSGVRADLGHYVRSRWEANVARVLIRRGVSYLYEPESFAVQLQGVTRYYRPDFRIVGRPVYIEVKGYMSEEAQSKIAAFQTQYPHLKLVLLCAKQYARLCQLYGATTPHFEVDRYPARDCTPNPATSGSDTVRTPQQCAANKIGAVEDWLNQPRRPV